MLAKKIYVLLWVLIFSVLSAENKSDTSTASNELIVHEWGTFTSVAGIDGKSMLWRPFSHSEDDLPSFVYGSESWLKSNEGLRQDFRKKRSTSAIIRMETPVIYFYSAQKKEVSVKVDFPQGQITEWYPHARGVWTGEYIGDIDYLQKGIDWGRMTILPNTEMDLPREPGESHYYPARETDSALIRVCGEQKTQYEKFLFYRGVANFSAPLSITLQDNHVSVANAESVPVMILFEREGEKIGYQIIHPQQNQYNIPRPKMDKTMDSLLSDLEKTLISQGLYPKEAKSMIKTWRTTWFNEGLRMFYIFPQTSVDKVLPLHIQPEPKKIVRTFVGNVEIITDKQKEDLLQLAKQKNVESIIRNYGRFAEPILKSLKEQYPQIIDEILTKINSKS